jgi:hypothetical protein
MTDDPMAPLVTPPSAGLDPMISLATSLHASPGVYALLLGSGVSTAAGIPTGWQIVSDLVRRAATAKFPDDPSAGETAAADPEAWWLKHGDGKPLGYSGLLESLASTPAARHALLAGYFEPTPEEQAEGLKAPGAAHLAVAQLVARGTVRVVLTTNFDRLLERALEALGVQPQVLHRPEQIAAATPLRHHRATIIKLHGDYADLDKRNTVDELQKYPPETQGLLRCVLDEYGLLIAGWSAEWDVALAAALEETRSRRYPLFWSFYGSSLGDTARRLVAQQGAVQMSGQTADELFGGVLARTEALDRLADPPISRAVAVTRLKRALPDPVRRIELYDLVDREVGAVVKRVQDQERYPLVIDPLTPEALEERIASLRGDTDTLLHLLAAGVFHDVNGAHDSLWVRVIQRLMSARDAAIQLHQEALEKLRHYPALLAVCTAGVAGVLAGRDDVVATLFRQPQWRSTTGMMLEMNAALALYPHNVVSSEVVNSLPRWGLKDQTYFFPQSHLLRTDIREPLRDIEPDDGRFTNAFDRLELLVGLVCLAAPRKYKQVWWGEVGLGNRWNYGASDELRHEGLARVLQGTSDPNWTFLATAGVTSTEEATQLGVELTTHLEQMREKGRWG